MPQWWWTLKRAIDVVLGLVLLLLATPFIAIAAIGIVLVTGGSPIFAQERVGQNGRRFKMFKLRTMVKNAHELRDQLMHLNEVDGPVFKIRKDPRLHPLGGLLRRTSIDELPNLINVVLGDISLVGPRPALPVRNRALRQRGTPAAARCRKASRAYGRSTGVATCRSSTGCSSTIPTWTRGRHSAISRSSSEPSRRSCARTARINPPPSRGPAPQRHPRMSDRAFDALCHGRHARVDDLGFFREVVNAQFYGTRWEMDTFLAAATIPTIFSASSTARS